MLQQFQNHLSQHFPFLKGKKLLLAVSGGLDSMVLLHLFQQLDYEIVVLHCNFQLRGLESFGDQQFIQEYTSQHNIQLSFTQFDTEAFANDYKLSIQIAARELRYSWFYEQLEIQEGDYILTAHHADDSANNFSPNFSSRISASSKVISSLATDRSWNLYLRTSSGTSNHIKSNFSIPYSAASSNTIDN